MSDNGKINREVLEQKLELLKTQRDTMLENANRQMAQMDGAIGFLEQLLSGELDDPAGEDATEPVIVEGETSKPQEEAS